MLQIMTASKSSSGRRPSSLQSSPGHCAVPTKALLSTETLRSSPQGQCSDAGSVAPHSSSLPVSPCSPSAASYTDVSAAKWSTITQHAHTMWAASISRWYLQENLFLYFLNYAWPLMTECFQSAAALLLSALFIWIVILYCIVIL